MHSEGNHAWMGAARPEAAGRSATRLVRGAICLVSLLLQGILVALILIGPGGCSKQEQKPVTPAGAQSDRSAASAPRAQRNQASTDEDDDEYADREDQRDEEPGRPSLTDRELDSDEEPQADVRQLPADVAEWKPEDFASARLQDDPRLADAVIDIGQRSAGNGEVAKMLVGLLAVETVAAPAAGGGEPDRSEEGAAPGTRTIRVGSDVVDAVIQALARNGSPEALTALKDVLLGKIEVSMGGRELISQVISGLASDINPEKEKILFVLLTKPDQITSRLAASADSAGTDRLSSATATRSPLAADEEPGSRSNQDQLEPQWVQEQVISEAGPVTSSQFRTELATFLKSPDVTAETAALFENFLIEQDARNIGAQVILLENPQTEERTIQQIEQSMIDASREALGQLLGFADVVADREGGEPGRFSRPAQRRASQIDRESSRPSRRRSRSDDAEQPVEEAGPVDSFAVARTLWKPTLVDSLKVSVRRTAGEESDEVSRTPMLLATIPLAGARTKLGELFAQQSSQGTEALTSLGLTGENQLVDPAVLVLAKQAYHGTSPRRPNRTRRTTGQRGESDATSEDSDESPSLETLVRELCERCRGVAEPAVSEEQAKSADRPIRLHRGANVVAEFRLRWPAQLDKRWADLPIAPLDLYYLRIEEEGRARTLLPIYRRQLPRAEEHDISGGLWIDAFTSRGMRSTDIRITSESGDLELGASPRDRSDRSNQRAPYVIEILSVAIGADEEQTPGEKTES